MMRIPLIVWVPRLSAAYFRCPARGNVRFMATAVKESYLHLPGKLPLMYKTVTDVIDEAAENFRDRTAFVAQHQGVRLSFGEARDMADELASGLLALGVRIGDRVSLWGPNSTEWYIANLAIAKCGAISVYINPAYQSLELLHSLHLSGSKVLIAADSFKTQNYFNIIEEIIPEIRKCQPGKLQSEKLPSLETIIFMSDKDHPGSLKYKDVAGAGTQATKAQLKDVKVGPEEPCNIQFTSGTTGKPKGATLSHFAIVNNSYLMSKRQGFHEKETVMCVMGPFFHAMGAVIGILTCFHHGATVVVPDYSYNPKKCITAIDKEKCTALLGTPTMYVDIIHLLNQNNQKLQGIDVAITGGALCSPELFKKMLNTMGVQRVASAYGMTESGPVTFMSEMTDSEERTTTTVGSIMEHTEAKVVDANGVVVPRNTPGELYIRGYLVMNGYWNDNLKTEETFTRSGWLKTGDQFVIDDEGYGKIVGRIKDLIIRGGENISPSEVEEFLSTHPDVLEIQVFGVPDERLGEQVCVCLKLKPGCKMVQSDVQEYCKGKIAHFKIPHYVYCFDEFPRTASGKIQRFKLRNKVLEILQKGV